MYTYCPRDNFALTAKNLSGTEVFQCTHCHGLWIPKDGILSLNRDIQIPLIDEQIKQTQLPEHLQHGTVLCPSDGAGMLFTVVSDIEVDICPACHGVWLDKGEMESLLATQTSAAQSSHSPAYTALDVLIHLPYIDSETIRTGAEVVGDSAGAVAEVAVEAASGAGEILGNLLGAIAEALFSG